jgi:uncharacterized protein (TIGR02300 family)
LTETLTHDKAVVQVSFYRERRENFMSKPEWGIKRMCPSCNTRFYDMRHHPIICPKCTNTFDPDALVKKRRGRPPASEVKPLPLPPELDEALVLDLGEELVPLNENDNILEDTSDFGADEDVVGIESTSHEDER